MVYTCTNLGTHICMRPVPDNPRGQHALDYFPHVLLLQTHLPLLIGTILCFGQRAQGHWLRHYKYETPWHWIRANSLKTKRHEWMTHNSCHEVTSVEFRDWMEVNVEVKRKKRKRGGCTSPLRVEARCMRPSSAERRVAGWICIHGVGPWENVSLGCIVSHIRSHLENHLPKSPCSSSLSPPLALPVHSRTNTQKNYPQNSFIPRLSNCLNAEQLYTQTRTHTLAARTFSFDECVSLITDRLVFITFRTLL